MTLLEEFLAPSSVSLKICGVTSESDARTLIEMEVEAMGINFWPNSKRYAPPQLSSWLKNCANLILRVGVFVNPNPDDAIRLVEDGFIDIIQLHGDESPQDTAPYLQHHIPFIKATGVKSPQDAERALDFGANAILLDAHAPGLYGGTGSTFDWNNAIEFLHQHPNLSLILAGGITPNNAADAARTVHPAALDVASGAESSPGIKDFEKIRAILHAMH